MTTTTQTIPNTQTINPGFLRRWFITGLALVLFSVSLFALFNLSQDKDTTTSTSSTILVDLANKDRQAKGLKPLKYNTVLEKAAYAKANDMLKYNYFEHFSPQGKSPWDFIIGAGYEYSYAGENLAMDFQVTEDIHTAWMNSPSHKANILDSHFREVGIATVSGELQGHNTSVTVEMFGTPANISIYNKP